MSFRLARRAALAIAATAVTATAAFGCGTATELSTRQELSNALGALDDRAGLTMSVSLDATPERLVEIATAEGGEMALRDAEVLVGSSLQLTIASPDGTALSEMGEDTTSNVRVLVDTPMGEMADVRLVDGSLYGRVDLPAVGQLIGEPVPTAAELGLGDVPALAFMDAALAGEWISIAGDELAAIGDSMGLTPEAATEEDASMVERLRQKVSDAFDRTVTVTEDGSDAELGDRILVEASPRRLAEELPGLLEGIQTPQGDAGDLVAELAEDLSDVPEEPVTVAVYRRDGVVTAIRLDLGQFDEAGTWNDVGLLVRFTRGDAGVEAPADATPVDLMGLGELIFAQAMASTNA